MPPLIARAGREGLRTTVTCNLGRVTDWTYTRNATGRDLSVTLAGKVTAPKGTALEVSVLQDGQRVTFGPLPTDGEYSVRRLPGGAFTTELRASDTLYRTLSHTSLPELIWWVNNPSREMKSSNTRTIFRGKKSIGEVLSAAFPALGVNGAILHEQSWEETRREYSTAGKSPIDVFNDTYGQLNYELVFEKEQGGSFRGYAPGESRRTVRAEGWAAWSEAEARTVLQYPHAVAVKGADLWTRAEEYLKSVAVSGTTADGAKDEQGNSVQVGSTDPEAANFELQDGWEATHVIRSSVNNSQDVSVSALRKTAGRVVQERSWTFGRVVRYSTEVLANGESRLKEWVTPTALLSSSSTRFAYLTRNGKTLRSTITTSGTYAYRPFIEYPPYSLPVDVNAQIGGLSPQVGDAVGSDLTRVDYVWSDYGGFLREKKTTEVSLSGLSQQDADIEDEANPNVPVRVGEKRFVTLETWLPTGEGWWLYTREKSGPKETYVFDSAGYIVKTLVTTAVLERTTELTRDAPPLTDEPDLPSPEEQREKIAADPTGEAPEEEGDPFPPFTWFQDPQQVGVELGGEGPDADLNLPFVEKREDLAALGRLWAEELKPKVTREVTLVQALDLDLRDKLEGYGLVRALSASGVGAGFRLSLTTEARDA